MKPRYTYFYTSDNAVDKILEYPPFSYDKPIKIRKGRNEAIIEYEHFDLFCYRMENLMLSMKGHKTWQILVEDILYNKLSRDYLEDILYPMMCPYDLLGGRIVKVSI